jgi:hypothetical protein
VLTSDLPAFNARLSRAHLAPVEKRALPAAEQGSNARNDTTEDDR